MIETTPFGNAADGRPILLFHCANSNGCILRLTNYGAIVVDVETPDRNGATASVTLGFSDLAGYLQRHPYFGATVGRYGNRIALGKFELEGVDYQLATNDAPHHLHGGDEGFDRATWLAEPFESNGQVGVRFSYKSVDGEEGFPGELDVEALYSLSDENELRMEFSASTDRPTHLNLTNHCYWNLAGVKAGDAPCVADHRLQLESDHYVPVDSTLIPTGELASVQNTPLDFRAEKRIGADLERIDAEPRGYDHCYVLRGEPGQLRTAAVVSDPQSGRRMEVLTNQPGIQLYTGNFLDESKECGGYAQHCAFCLEAQHFPDSPNQPAFPSTLLRPGQTYHHLTVHRFAT